MPLRKKRPQKNSKIQFTKDFIKEWPEVLEGLSFSSLPMRYINAVNFFLKNKIKISIDVAKELKNKTEKKVLNHVFGYINKNYKNIEYVDIKINIAKVKEDMQSKTAKIIDRTFKKKS